MSADEPARSLADPSELLQAYLDYYRDALLRKLEGLQEPDLRRSVVPSGWTPLELLVHLTWVERRWFRWGFAGEPTDEPWGDQGPDGRWYAPTDETPQTMIAEFLDESASSRQIVAGVPLSRRAQTGGRFATEADAPALAWILFHVLQEYARHVGHLDIVRELIDGTVGE
ncbi:MAG: DinB family protein [Jiangellaceae bacterium]|nr:DinB family protein [Jiangellaceae bacterium]